MNATTTFAHVDADFARQGFLHAVGASLRVLEPGHAELRMPFGPGVAQQHGFFHGAMIGAAGDVACGYAALSVLPPGSSVLAVDYAVHFLEPANGDELIARGRLLRAGKRLLTCQADILVVRDGAEHLVAVMTETVNGRRPTSEAGAVAPEHASDAAPEPRPDASSSEAASLGADATVPHPGEST